MCQGNHFNQTSIFQECETKIAQEIASLSKEDVSKEEMNENEEVINILLAQVDSVLILLFSLNPLDLLFFCQHTGKANFGTGDLRDVNVFHSY